MSLSLLVSTMSMRGKGQTNAQEIIKALYKKSATAGPRTFGQQFWVFFNSKGFFYSHSMVPYHSSYYTVVIVLILCSFYAYIVGRVDILRLRPYAQSQDSLSNNEILFRKFAT